MKTEDELREWAREWAKDSGWTDRESQVAFKDGVIDGYREGAKDAEKLAAQARVKALEEAYDAYVDSEWAGDAILDLITQARKEL